MSWWSSGGSRYFFGSYQLFISGPCTDKGGRMKGSSQGVRDPCLAVLELLNSGWLPRDDSDDTASLKKKWCNTQENLTVALNFDGYPCMNMWHKADIFYGIYRLGDHQNWIRNVYRIRIIPNNFLGIQHCMHEKHVIKFIKHLASCQIVCYIRLDRYLLGNDASYVLSSVSLVLIHAI